VIIVDDEVDLRNAIVAYLTQEGYEVQAASNGEEALERVRSVPFDILVTDMKLPGIDGTTVLQEALALYRSEGFAVRDAYYDYPADGASIFMEKSLAASGDSA